VLYLQAHPVRLAGRVITVTDAVSVDFALLWKLEPSHLAAAALTVAAVSALAALYPAYRASRGVPADALRSP
jgi:ABC-type lipoprotein release transport system permease subunit